MLLLGLIPAAEERIVDGDQLDLEGELVAELLEDVGIARAIVILAGQTLSVLGVQKGEVFRGQSSRAALVDHRIDHGHRRLGQNAGGRRDNVELVGNFGDRQMRLVFPSQQDVALTVLHERVGRAAGPVVEHQDIVENFLYELQNSFLVMVVGFVGPGPGGQIIPSGAAGSLGIGRDHADPLSSQIAPVLDVLGIALADQKDDGGSVGRAVFRQSLLPALADEARLLDGGDVVGQSQRQHVGVVALDDGAGLLRRTAVRLDDLDVLPALFLPMILEQDVVLLVKFASGIVGDVDELHFVGRGRRGGRSVEPGQAQPGGQAEKGGQNFLHGEPPFGATEQREKQSEKPRDMLARPGGGPAGFRRSLTGAPAAPRKTPADGAKKKTEEPFSSSVFAFSIDRLTKLTFKTL
jgi:hypothetical protein